MNKANVKTLIGKSGTSQQVDTYLAYIEFLEYEKNKDGSKKNPWMAHKKDEYLARIFVEVLSDGLVFDGESVTLQNTGVSYDYQAYKNKMLLAYPESIIDVGTVHDGDKFVFNKESGRVIYSHSIANPFDRSEKNIIGTYCVIKNSRGEFLTLLSKSDIDKHRKVAKTDYIWKNWYLEMVNKTVMKKACKQHFNDVYSNIERLDNENYDLDNLDDKISPEQAYEIDVLIKATKTDKTKVLEFAGVKDIKDIPADKYGKIFSSLSARPKVV